MSQIKAVFVDISGVLVKNALPDLYSKYQSKYGLSKATFRQILHHYALTRAVPADLSDYLKTLSVPASVWNEFLGEFLASEAVNLSLARILASAKEKGVKIVITSNNVVDLKSRLLDLGLSALPDLIIASGDIGLTKPDPAFWREAFKKTKLLVWDLKPEEVIVVDDHPDNLLSAKVFGFKTIGYFGDLEAADKKLQSLLVL